MTTTTQRVAAYIDGFNLYYGLRSRGWRRYYWLNLSLLVAKLLRPWQQLEAVRYFTTRIYPEPGDTDKAKRQSTYLEALATLPDLTIHYGYFLPKTRTCRQCGAIVRTYEEKMTDVNIAVELLGDAQDDVFDTAMVISGDSDLSGPIESVRLRYPGKRVIVAFPPDRASQKLRSGPWFTIGRDAFRDSQLPAQVINASGHVLTRPTGWD